MANSNDPSKDVNAGPIQTSQTLRPAHKRPMPLLSTISSLRNDDKYTDLEIRCQGKVFKVHKAIVCKQVDFFASCVDGNFQESQTGVIELKEDIPEIVENFIDFLYTEDYIVKSKLSASVDASKATSTEEVDLEKIAPQPDSEPETLQLTITESSEMLHHSHMYTIADKYMVKNLQGLAAQRFSIAISKAGEKDLNDFTSVLKAVFEGSPADDRALKDACITFCCVWYNKLSYIEDFRKFCRANGDVCLEILDEQSDLKELAVESNAEAVKQSRKPCKKCKQHKCTPAGMLYNIPSCPECDDQNDVRASSFNDIIRYGGHFYCVHCRCNFNMEVVA